MINKDIQTARKLVNRLMNETLDRWSQKENGKVYLIRYSMVAKDGFAIQPTHGTVFYGIDEYIKIADVTGCSCYVDVSENQDGLMTPTLNFH